MHENTKTIENEINLKPEGRNYRFGINFSSRSSQLFYYCVTMFFICMADAIMSYTTPSFLEDHLTSTALMGIIFATSSLVGFTVDFLLGELFESKSYKFFLKWGIILAIGFPLGYLIFPTHILTLVLGLAIWGVYYEFISFSNSQYVTEKTRREDHEMVWGILYFSRAGALTFAPIIAAVLIDISYEVTFLVAIAFLAVAALLYFFMPDRRSKTKVIPLKDEKVELISVRKELKIWGVFTKRIWLLLLFCFGIIFIDAGFWTVGAVLSEQLHTEHGGIPGLLLVLYSLPMFFMGFFAKKVAMPYGKKKAAFITALIGSIPLILIGFTTDYTLINLFVFIFACFFALMAPEIKGVFADFDARMNRSRNSLIGLESGIYSLGYIIGPIVCGFLADKVGLRQTFTVLGIGMIVVIFLCLLFVPRKVKMPRHELERLGVE